MDDIIKVLEDYYTEYGRGRGLEYTYGYMDALALIRELADANAASGVQFIGQDIS